MRTLLPFVSACVIAVTLSVPFPMSGTDATEHRGRSLAGRIRRMEKAKPQVVLIGDSILGEGVDEGVFGLRSGLRTQKICTGGAASAWWYLAIKNVVCASSWKPAVVMIFFRDHYLTDPTFRVNGPYYEEQVRGMARDSEPLLDQLAYHAEAEGGGYWSAGRDPVVRHREEIRLWLVDCIKRTVAFGVRVDVDRAIQAVLGRQNMDRQLFGRAQQEVESLADEPDHDFTRAVDRSFLPAMITLLKKHDVRTVFVRCKKRRDVHDGQEPDWLVEYLANLKGFLAAKGIPFYDFTHDERIHDGHYADGDHFGAEGRALFTAILADSLQTDLKRLSRAEAARPP